MREDVEEVSKGSDQSKDPITDMRPQEDILNYQGFLL